MLADVVVGGAGVGGVAGPGLERLGQDERAVDQVAGADRATGRTRSAARHPRWRSRSPSWTAKYVFATPGVNGPNVAAGPSVSDSVAGTVPPTAAGHAGAVRGRRRTAGRRRVGPRTREVRDRVLEDRGTLRPRGDALEAEAPQQRVLGRDARAVGEADRAARDPRRRVLGARGLRAGDPRGEAGLEARWTRVDRAVLDHLQRVEEHAEAADGEVLRVGDRDLDLLALVGASGRSPSPGSRRSCRWRRSTRRSCRCWCSRRAGVGLVW